MPNTAMISSGKQLAKALIFALLPLAPFSPFYPFDDPIALEA